MSNPFVQKEVSKIINDQGIEYPKNIALAAAWIMANFKSINIKIYDVKDSSSLCDYNIIASGINTAQARAIVDELQVNLRENGSEIISLEGLTDGEWILLDAGDIIVHLFQEHARDVFDLDSLWSNFPQIEIPQDYYFSSPAMAEAEAEKAKAKASNPTDNYF